jgi:endonuclease/exonuclease/phosphatase family metal-dependent hydrolase
VLGGDFNLRDPQWPGFTGVAGHDVDHVFIAGALAACGGAETLDRGMLSDHVPVAVDLCLTAGQATV